MQVEIVKEQVWDQIFVRRSCGRTPCGQAVETRCAALKADWLALPTGQSLVFDWHG
jgi:hypothetical protein